MPDFGDMDGRIPSGIINPSVLERALERNRQRRTRRVDSETRTCQEAGCLETFECRVDSLARYCTYHRWEHSSTAAANARVREKRRAEGKLIVEGYRREGGVV